MPVLFDNKIEIRYYIKILQGSQQALAETVYFRDNLKSELFHKWRWYFEYRAALFRINKPRFYCKIEWGSYKMELESEAYEKKLKNLIAAKKRKITELSHKIETARKSWDELWPIENHPLWTKVEAKVDRLQTELKLLETEFNSSEIIKNTNGL